MKRKTSVVAFAVLSSSLLACWGGSRPSGGDGSPGPGGDGSSQGGGSTSEGGGTYCAEPNDTTGNLNPVEPGAADVAELTFTEATVAFESTEDILSVEQPNQTYRFKKTSTQAQALKPGSILFIHETALRKVSRVHVTDDEIVAETEEATLNELIRDGVLQWTTDVHFGPNSWVQLQVGNKTYEIQRSVHEEYDGQDTQKKFEISYDGWDFEMVLKPEAGGSTWFAFEAKQGAGAGPLRARFKAEGRLCRFTASNRMEYRNSQLVSFSNYNANTKADLTLSMAFTTPPSRFEGEIPRPPAMGEAPGVRPFAFWTFPARIGPIPVNLRVRIYFLYFGYVPAFGTAHALAHFKYESDLGFQYTGGDVLVQGVPRRLGVESEDFGLSTPASLAWGFGIPQLELSVFGVPVIPWIRNAVWLQHDLTFVPICNKLTANWAGAVGYHLSILGVQATGIKNLWMREESILRQEACRD